MDAPPGSHCRVRGQGVERRRGQVTLGGASDGCQIRTLGAMGRDVGEDTGMETTAAQRLRSTHHFPCNGLENDAEYGEEKADRKNKRPFVTTLAAPPQRATAARWRGPHQGGVRWSAPWAG